MTLRNRLLCQEWPCSILSMVRVVILTLAGAIWRRLVCTFLWTWPWPLAEVLDTRNTIKDALLVGHLSSPNRTRPVCNTMCFCIPGCEPRDSCRAFRTVPLLNGKPCQTLRLLMPRHAKWSSDHIDCHPDRSLGCGLSV